jgi:DNA-binding transcriptional MerR regulator
MTDPSPTTENCGINELVPDVDEPLTVGQVADLTGLSVHTLRWYERVGLLDGVARDQSGYRRYTSADLRWLAMCMRLRATGMPVSEMLSYAELARSGPATETQRLELLEAHRDRVLAHIADLHRDLDVINRKIAGYQRSALERLPTGT